MSILYGKIRINGEAGQTITITTPTGQSRTIQTTGQSYTDVILAGLEEYTLSNGALSETVLLNIGDFQEISLPIVPPANLEDASWALIQRLIARGDFANYYAVGDTKSFVMNGKTYTAEVVSINDGTGSAGSWYPARTVDFITRELYETTYQYNSTNDNTGGFPSSALRNTLVNTLYPLLPSDLKDVIIEKSHSYIISASGVMGTDATKLWLPTRYEIFGTTASYAPGETASNNKPYTLASKIKGQNGQTSANYWWLGSLFSNDPGIFWRIGTNGGQSTAWATDSQGVPICFRIGQGGDNE